MSDNSTSSSAFKLSLKARSSSSNSQSTVSESSKRKHVELKTPSPTQNGQIPTRFSVIRREPGFNSIKREVVSEDEEVVEDDAFWLKHFEEEVFIKQESKQTQTKLVNDHWLIDHYQSLLNEA